MKQFLTKTSLLLCWLAVIARWTVSFSYAIFQSIEQNCLLKEWKYIDICPEKQKVISSVNKIMYDIRTQEEKNVLWKNELIKLSEDKKNILQLVDKKLFLDDIRTPDKVFILQYMMHLITLYIEELNAGWTVTGKVDKLFTKTYFDQDQSWLAITSITSQPNSQFIRQYDPYIALEINIRNYSKEIITEVEDIYCFATIWNKDYIFPLNVPINIFDSNSIKTININLNTEDHQILHKTWDQTLYCTMVYHQNDKEKIIPYVPFHFTILPA